MPKSINYIIGQVGDAIKKLGFAARKDLEDFFGKKSIPRTTSEGRTRLA